MALAFFNISFSIRNSLFSLRRRLTLSAHIQPTFYPLIAAQIAPASGTANWWLFPMIKWHMAPSNLDPTPMQQLRF